MFITIISVILLLFLASFFVSVKFSGPGASNRKHVEKSNESGEIPPPSSGLARFEEMRFDFLRFSEFFFLNKRPYGVNNPINSPQGSINTQAGAHEIGVFDSEDSEACKLACEDDEDCNAYSHGENAGINQCSKFDVYSPNAIESTGADSIGYVFRPSDSWAVTDLSNLPKNKNFFKDVANITLLLKSKVQALNVKSQMILNTDNVKYCYDIEPVSTPSANYLEARQIAIDSAERAIEFFLFSKNVQYPKKVELALACINLLLNDLDNTLFGGNSEKLTKRQEIMSTIALSGLDVANVKYRALLDAMQKYDNDENGYLTREEYKKMIQENNSYIFSIDNSELTEKELSSNNDGCLNNEDVDYYVNTFFNDYDHDRDNRVYPIDLLEGLDNLLNLLTPPSNCFMY